jgi:hypothetical protein
VAPRVHTPSRMSHTVDRLRERLQLRTGGSLLGASLVAHAYWYIFYKPIAFAAEPFRGDLHCRLVTLADLPVLDVFAPYRSIRRITDWLREEETWLFVAFDGERPVAYDCVSLATPYRRPFSRVMLADDEIWVRDVYTVPEYRRRHVFRMLRSHRNHVMRELGFRGTVSAVAEDNIASLVASYEQTTWKVTGLDYRRVLLARRIRVDSDARLRLTRLLAARRAPSKVIDARALPRSVAFS